MNISDAMQQGNEVRFEKLPEGFRPLPSGRISDLKADLVFVRFDKEIDVENFKDLHRKELNFQWQTGGRQYECPAVVKQIGKGLLCVQPSISEKRSFLRIPARMILTYEEISEESLEQARKKIQKMDRAQDDFELEVATLFEQEDLEDRVNEQYGRLINLLKQVDSKLDYVISMNEGDSAPRPKGNTVHLLDISGAGLGFLCENSLDPDRYLHLTIHVSRFPEVTIHAIAKVVRSILRDDEKKPPIYEIGVIFDTIHEEDRERIFRFISRAERQILRKRKEAMADHF